MKNKIIDIIINNNAMLKVISDKADKPINEVINELEGIRKLIKEEAAKPKRDFYNGDFNDYLDDISISKYVYKLNTYGKKNNMKRIYPKQIINWLLEKGLLKEIKENSKMVKIPTEEGNVAGIKRVTLINKDTNFEYQVNIYNINAQKFILENIQHILGYNGSS